MYVHATDDSIEFVSSVQADGITVQVPDYLELPETFIDGQESEFSADLANLLSEIAEAELAEQHGRKVGASVAPPDPWLVTVAWVMCESIAKGLTWEAAKPIVQRVIKRLIEMALAPKRPGERATESGHETRWSFYLEVPKLVKLYHNLERTSKVKKTEKWK